MAAAASQKKKTHILKLFIFKATSTQLPQQSNFLNLNSPATSTPATSTAAPGRQPLTDTSAPGGVGIGATPAATSTLSATSTPATFFKLETGHDIRATNLPATYTTPAYSLAGYSLIF